MTSHHPVILSMKLNRALYVTQLYPMDRSVDSWNKIRDYEGLNPLPTTLEKSTTFSPFGLLILTKTIVEPLQGWRLQSSLVWGESPKRHRDMLMKNA